MSSTAQNPGAFRRQRVRGPRAIAAAAAKALLRGEYRAGTMRAVVDSINLAEALANPRLQPRFRCTCCGHTAHAFRHMFAGGRIAWNSACPQCDSRSRHRGLVELIPQLLEAHAPIRILHFAPEPVLAPCFTMPGIRYETADLFLQDVTHTRVDLEATPFADASYDFVVCNHVLEHVADDEAALRELARIVVPGGVALITVPGEFSRDRTLQFAGALENGHYRDYGRDLTDRLRNHFGRVDAIDLHDFDRDPSGMSRAIRANDLAFVCMRATHG